MSTATARVAGPTLVHDAIELIESEPRLDAVADSLSGFGRTLREGPLGPFLRGDALGHSPHPTVAMLRLGFLGSSLVAGLVGGRSGQKVAGRLAAVGVAMSVPAAATAAVELADEDDVGTRRVAAAYAVASASAGLLFFRRWLSGARGHGFRGFLWSVLGAAPLAVAACLGGHLTGAKGFASGARGVDAPAVAASDAEAPADAEHTADDAPHAAIRAL